MSFGEYIRQWREEHRLGLRRFAKAVGVRPTFVSKMERGRSLCYEVYHTVIQALLLATPPGGIVALVEHFVSPL